MIGALHGTIESIQDQTVLLMTGGVGYQLAVPQAAALETGTIVTLHTYLAVRETALDLYGFLSKDDKDVFILLLSVPKIGPKSALDIMTKAESSFLIECIQTDDPSRLQKLSSIGKKTCENIVTNLHNKVEHLAPMSTVTGEPVRPLNTTQTDAIDALVSLGYDPKTAREKVAGLSEDTTLSVSDLVARALK